MTPGSRMMLHNSWCFGEGNADYFASLIKELHSIDQSMAEFYAARSGKPIDEIKALMQAETYFGAEEAVRLGFADRVEGSLKTIPVMARAERVKPPMPLVKRQDRKLAELQALAEKLEKRP